MKSTSQPPPAHRIYRRPFNPSIPGAKDIRVIVARFNLHCKAEAEATLKFLQDQATSLIHATEFSNYRYTLVSDPVPTKESSELAALQIIDTSKARFTKRPISYELTWDVKHDICHMLAYHNLYGSIRAEIEDSVKARQFFVRGIKRVWPNAEISSK